MIFGHILYYTTIVKVPIIGAIWLNTFIMVYMSKKHGIALFAVLLAWFLDNMLKYLTKLLQLLVHRIQIFSFSSFTLHTFVSLVSLSLGSRSSDDLVLQC